MDQVTYTPTPQEVQSILLNQKEGYKAEFVCPECGSVHDELIKAVECSLSHVEGEGYKEPEEIASEMTGYFSKGEDVPFKFVTIRLSVGEGAVLTATTPAQLYSCLRMINTPADVVKMPLGEMTKAEKNSLLLMEGTLFVLEFLLTFLFALNAAWITLNSESLADTLFLHGIVALLFLGMSKPGKKTWWRMDRKEVYKWLIAIALGITVAGIKRWWL